MTQILVSIENHSTIDSIMNAIKMLKGVTDARLWVNEPDVTHQKTERKYSARIERLRNLKGKGITPDEIQNDERLAYLLNK